MKTRALFSALLPLVLAIALRAADPAATPAPAWAQEKSDIAADPAVTWGRLENGIRYAILPNAEPKDRVSVRLLIRTGALAETEAQRGLAHFIEHMGFNGTRNFPPGKLVEYFQRLGMAFGPDTNAATGFDMTFYQVELPKNDRTSLEEAFKALRDYADGNLFLADEIEQERGVILAEKRERDSVEFRAAKAEFAFVLPGTLVARRFPIGEEEVIRNAPRQEFVDYYDTWYRPEKMALVVVGQIQPSEVAPLIAAAFGDLKNRLPARPAPDYGRIVAPQTVTAALHRDPELSRTVVSIQTTEPYAYEPDTAANRLKYLPRNLAYTMINRRLTELAKKEGAVFTTASANTTEFLDFVRNSSIEVSVPKSENWPAGLAVAEQELRRALEHGFQPAELREAVASLSNHFEDAVKQAPTRRSEAIAGALVQALATDNVFNHPVVDRDLFKPALAKVTVEDCSAALRAAWTAPGRLLFVSGNLALDKPSAAIVAAYEQSRAVAVAAPARIEESAWAYTHFGPSGEVSSRREIADLGITQLEFKNGVRLNLKKTPFESATIHVLARVGGGLLTVPAGKDGLRVFSNATAGLMGLGRHSADDLRRILAGRTVSASLRVADDAVVISGKTTPSDLELQLQLLAAAISDPGYRPEAERLVRRSIGQAYTQMQHTPEGLFDLEIQRFLANGDTRFGMPTQERLAAYTMEDVRAWLGPQLGTGALEVSIAGDLDVDACIALAARTIGALPSRAPKPAYDAERRVSFPASSVELARSVQTDIPRGSLFVFWPTDDARDVRRSRRLNALAAVIDDRLRVKIREGLGGAYSPNSGSNPSDTFTSRGFLMVQVGVDPAQAPAILAAIREIAASLRQQGPSADELERAKQPFLTQIAESARTNAYWLRSVLAACQEYPQRLDWARTRTSDVQAITREDVSELAARYLLREREVAYVVLPAPMPKPEAAPAAK